MSVFSPAGQEALAALRAREGDDYVEKLLDRLADEHGLMGAEPHLLAIARCPTFNVDAAQAKLAALAGVDAAEAMFQAVKKRHGKKPDALAEAVEELLKAHGIDPDGGPPPAPPAASPLVVHIAEALAEATATEVPKGDRPQAPTTHEEIIDSALRALAKKIGDDAAEAMFEHITKGHVTPQRLDEAIEELLKAHNVAWPPESSSPKPEPAAKAVAAAPAQAPKARTSSATQAALSQRARNRPGHVDAKSDYTMTGGFYRMPNAVADHLLANMPGPVLKAYVYAHRLARIDGTFWVSAGGLAKKIGCKSQRHGQRILERLQDAGLLRLLERGGPAGAKANTYQLVPPESLDLDAVRQSLGRPLAPHRVAVPNVQE